VSDRARFLGAMSLGACLPIGLQASGALSATLGFSLPELQAKIAGALALQAQLAITPPTIGVQIDGVLALIAQLQGRLDLSASLSAQLDLVVELLIQAQAALAAGLQLDASLAAEINGYLGAVAALQAQLALGLPGIDMQVSALLELLAELNVSLGLLQLQAAFLVELDALLATAGIYLYRYDGTAAGLGAQMTAALAAGLPGGTGPAQECLAIMLIAATPAAQAALTASFAAST